MCCSLVSAENKPCLCKFKLGFDWGFNQFIAVYKQGPREQAKGKPVTLGHSNQGFCLALNHSQIPGLVKPVECYERLSEHSAKGYFPTFQFIKEEDVVSVEHGLFFTDTPEAENPSSFRNARKAILVE
jgi:hypothetical protein